MRALLTLTLFLLVAGAVAALLRVAGDRAATAADARHAGPERRRGPEVASDVSPLLEPPATREAVSPTDVSSFAAGGSVALLVEVPGELPGDAPIALTWRARDGGGESVCEATPSSWSHALGSGEHDLAGARIGGIELAAVSPASVSEARPTCDLELFDASRRVLDVRDARDGRRIDAVRASVELRPEQEVGAVSIEGERVISADRAVWFLPSARVPFVCPEGAWDRCRVGADGYRDAVIDVPAAGVRRVELEPSRRLLIELAHPAHPGARYDVSVEIGSSFRTYAALRAPKDLRVDVESGERAVVEVVERCAFGPGAGSLVRDVALAPSGDTAESIDLARELVAAPTGVLELSLVSERDLPELGGWRVTLRAHGLRMHDGFSYDPPSRAVATWDVVTPSRECSTRIPGLRRGEYTLVLEPIALRRRVEVGAGTTSVRFEVGELAELTIRAVDESGRGAGDAGKLGALLWRVVEDAGPDLTQAFVLGPETGVPSFANVDAGAWRITTLAHREILVRLCGPDSIDAADLRIVPPAGPSEHELRVRGR